MAAKWGKQRVAWSVACSASAMAVRLAAWMAVRLESMDVTMVLTLECLVALLVGVRAVQMGPFEAALTADRRVFEMAGLKVSSLAV